MRPLVPPAATETATGSGSAESGAGLPSWAVWTIVGGSALLVAGGVTAAILLSRPKKPGTVVVSIQFSDAP